METYKFTIQLRSDAEPASGLGGEQKNSLLPRNVHGKVTIPASHLKGLMRESLYNLLYPLRDDAEAVCRYLFGRSGEEGDGGQPGIIHLTGASAEKEKVITVTRTKIGEDGRAEDTSLRTAEALATGSILTGEMNCGTEDPQILKLCRLALISIFELGGGRTRGAGACRIVITEHESETPGQLLRDSLGAVVDPSVGTPVYTEKGTVGNSCRALKLHFLANTPICLPERPHGKNNVISSGFQIPGTAVAGTLLNLLSEADPELASACFRSGNFRCYPALPIQDAEDCLLPVLISNSHKNSKIPQQETGKYLFGDLMIPDDYLEEDYRWQNKTAGISMKGSSGVLIVHSDKSVELLKNSDIPRYYTAHGVVNGSGDKKDNLFTMESVWVKHFSGLVILPSDAAEKLLEILKDGHPAFFGKAKSTHGSGMLKAEEWPLYPDLENGFPQVERLKNRLFIVQSPIVFDAAPETSTMDILNQVLKEAGWGEAEAESVMTSVLFGWNRLGLKAQVNRTGRVKACRIILPGSVFLLKEPLTDLPGKLAAGLGSDRYGGYGAVIPHPMFASRLYESVRNKPEKSAGGSRKKSPVYCGYALNQICGQKLSASQIAGLLRCVQISNGKAEEFLDIQKTTRPKRIWDQWGSVEKQLREYLGNYNANEMTEMIRVWHDLRIGRDSK